MTNGHPLDADCIGLWRMNESNATDNAVDASTLANAGVQTGSPSCVAGQVGGARDMSAATRRFLVPYQAAYNGLTAFTVAMWFYYDGTIFGYDVIGRGLIRLPHSTYGGWVICLGALDHHENRLFADVHGTSWNRIHGSAASDLTAGIHHLVLTYASTNAPANLTDLELWLDGVKVIDETTAIYIGPTNVNYGPLLGAEVDGGTWSHQWPGWIDDVALYNTKKSDAWISTTGDITSPNVTNQNPASAETNVVLNSNVLLDVLDTESGVDETTVWITFNNGSGEIDVFKNSVQQAGYIVTETGIANGYNYTINPNLNFLRNETITVRVRATDNNGNSLDTTYSFDIIKGVLYRCGLCDISSDFTLNHYKCLSTNYIDYFGNNQVYTVPFSLIRRPLWHISGSHMR